jgi:phosphoenolpyruvate---glycerone phosphotransferase subunit DhaL
MGRLNMGETVGTAALDQWIRSFALLVAENKDLLTDLDAAIGDGDHGSNMDRGMQAVVAALDDTTQVTASALFNKVGMTLVSTVGGASGPLFGTFFIRVGTSLGDTAEITLGQLATALRAGLEGIVARGKAEAGDKTMYDALAPAVNALDVAVSDGRDKADALKMVLVAAESGRDATTPMLARKGRASYLGERSVGHQDPGATSVALLMAAATRALL